MGAVCFPSSYSREFLQAMDVTIHDVLKFKRALTYMDETDPFGVDFGPARNRNECITSSHRIFYQLLKLAPGRDFLPFEILELVTVGEQGDFNDSKKNALRRVFRPDRGNQLTLLAFISTCDAIYKRLRYFRASVSNASVIDKVRGHYLEPN